MTALLTIFYVMGGLYILFGLIKAPSFIDHFFRVPGIFIFFIPEKHLLKVGRIVTGVLFIVVAIIMQIYLGDPTAYYNNFIKN